MTNNMKNNTVSFIDCKTSFRGYNKKIVDSRARLIQQQIFDMADKINTLLSDCDAVKEALANKNQECYEMGRKISELENELCEKKFEIEQLKNGAPITSKEVQSEEPEEPVEAVNEPESIKLSIKPEEPLKMDNVVSPVVEVYNENSGWNDQTEDENLFVGEIETKTIVNEAFMIGNSDSDEEDFEFL